MMMGTRQLSARFPRKNLSFDLFVWKVIMKSLTHLQIHQTCVCKDDWQICASDNSPWWKILSLSWRHVFFPEWDIFGWRRDCFEKKLSRRGKRKLRLLREKNILLLFHRSSRNYCKRKRTRHLILTGEKSAFCRKSSQATIEIFLQKDFFSLK